MTEQDLVARARAGDHQAFERLLLDNQTRIYTLCLRMTGDPEDAQDLAQEAFLNAWRGLPSFQGGSSFATWVYRLASNACIDFLRKRKRRQAVESPHSLDQEEAPWPEPADPAPGPAEALEGKELRQAVEDGLRALPVHQRQALIMRELSGLSYQEIAAALELDLGTVKSRIARARRAMQKFLVEQGNLSPSPPSKQSDGEPGGPRPGASPTRQGKEVV